MRLCPHHSHHRVDFFESVFMLMVLDILVFILAAAA